MNSFVFHVGESYGFGLCYTCIGFEYKKIRALSLQCCFTTENKSAKPRQAWCSRWRVEVGAQMACWLRAASWKCVQPGPKPDVPSPGWDRAGQEPCPQVDAGRVGRMLRLL